MSNSRIKRRNKCGFSGTGSHALFIPIYGKIKDFKLDFYQEDRKMLVKQVKARGFKHPGSMPLYKLNNIVKRNLYAKTHLSLNHLLGV